MKCNKVRILLDDYLQHKLDKELNKMIGLHADKCGKCRDALISIKILIDFIEKDKKIKASPVFYESICNKINRKIVKLPTYHRWLVAAIIIATVLSGIVTGYYTGKRFNNKINTYSEFLSETGIKNTENVKDWTDYVYYKNE